MRKRVLMLISIFASLILLFAPVGFRGQASIPRYDVDPSWPKPLPNRWVLGQVGGVCVDMQDHVFILNRQDLKDEELDAGRVAPAVIEFDEQGSVVNSWQHTEGLPRGLHGCTIDRDTDIWIVGEGSGIAQKYSHDGSKLLLKIGSEELRLSGIALDPENSDIYVSSGRTNPSVVVFDRTGERFAKLDFATN